MFWPISAAFEDQFENVDVSTGKFFFVSQMVPEIGREVLKTLRLKG